MKNYIVKKEFVSKHGHTVYFPGDIYPVEYPGAYISKLIEAGFITEDEVVPLAKWGKNGIVSKLANIIVAPEDYTEGDKKHFTYDEALEIEKKLPDGWRLPTRSEWVLLCEEFGQKDGLLNGDTLARNLHLNKNGYQIDHSLYCSGSYGYYWSRRAASDTDDVYALNFDSSGVCQRSSDGRYLGFSVRCVKDIKKEDK